jgi:hypothetical protein
MGKVTLFFLIFIALYFLEPCITCMFNINVQVAVFPVFGIAVCLHLDIEVKQEQSGRKNGILQSSGLCLGYIVM